LPPTGTASLVAALSQPIDNTFFIYKLISRFSNIGTMTKTVQALRSDQLRKT
jgi:hypothetical protein